MHSTLRTELRGTQKILNIARPGTTNQLRSRIRPFSQGYPRRSAAKAGDSPSNAKSEQASRPNKSSVASHPPRSSELGLEIEKWINHLSKHGRSLQVWDTISERDENGKWKLLPQARKDLEDVDEWARNRSSATNQPFGIKVIDGRIRAVPAQDIRQEQGSGVSVGLGHGPLVSGSGSTKAQENDQTPRKSNVLATNSPTSIEHLSSDTSEHSTPQLSPDAGSMPTSNLEAPKFYGSAAARRQRAQLIKDRTSSYVLPTWFSTQNISRQDQHDFEATTRIRISQGTSATGSRDGIVLWHTDDAKIASTSPGGDIATQSQENTSEDHAQALSTGGGAEPPENDSSGQIHVSSGSSTSSPIFIPLPDTDKTYFIEEAQHNELLATAKGRLRSPASGSLDNRPGGIRGHLIIHYAAADGELFLDHLVEDMSKRLGSNLIALDAQDISGLIIGADVDSVVKQEASILGYDVYSEIYKDGGSDQDPAQSNSSEEQEDADEDFGAPTTQGMPFVVGKPITIDLKALFSSKPHRKPSGVRPSNIMPDLFGSPGTAKPNTPLFAAIVDSILSSVNTQEKEVHPSGDLNEQEHPRDTKQPDATQGNRTIVHIKDLRSIQDTHIGKQFLAQLYEQVERRRAGGEAIMLVGTECSRDSRTSYDPARINSLQSGEQEEISSTLVITPVEAQGKDVLLTDRSRRLQVINARHLWQMLQSKNINLDSLQPSFWKGRCANSIHAADTSYLEKTLWSFGYVQRLAAILASSDFTTSRHPIAEAAAVIDLSDNSKFTWAQQGRKDGSGDTKTSSSERADRIAKIREKANKHEKRLLGGVIEPKKIATTFEDIHIPQDTVESLQTLTTLSLVRPDAFKYGVLASDRIPGLLLYGPPGTGKTLAAKAVARESGATMLEVSSADINDMYVGEGEKNVKALFSLAKKLSPCVVFLDEADAMFSARSAHGRRVSHRELLNQFLREWDGMSNDSGSAFIMVATNRPMDLDDAVLRRLPRRLLIDLPTEKDRLEILKIHLKHEQLADDVNLSLLATKTPFYSGSDLKNLAVSAALNAVREETAKAKKTEGEKAAEYPAKRTLTAHDFEKALEEIGASISEDMSSLREIKKFDEQYGDRKGRKRKSPKWGFKTSAEADAVLDTVKVRS